MVTIREATLQDAAQIYELGKNVAEFHTSDESPTFWPEEILRESINQDTVMLFVVARQDDTVWEGLRLVDFGIIPHWDNEKYKETLQKARVEMEKCVSVTTLGDTQALVIDGDSKRTVNA